MSDDGTESITARTSSNSGNSSGADDEDVAKRRSKNRVNARRSRERKRLILDTLQQEHWQLHQENKRVTDENEQLREAIHTIKSLQSKSNPALPATATSNASRSRLSPVGLSGMYAPQAVASANPPPQQSAPAPAAATNNPLEQMLAQLQGKHQVNATRQASTMNHQTPSQPGADLLTSLLLAKMLNANQQPAVHQHQQAVPTPPNPQENWNALAAGLNALFTATAMAQQKPQASSMYHPNNSQGVDLASLLQAAAAPNANSGNPGQQQHPQQAGYAAPPGALATLLQALSAGQGSAAAAAPAMSPFSFPMNRGLGGGSTLAQLQHGQTQQVVPHHVASGGDGHNSRKRKL